MSVRLCYITRNFYDKKREPIFEKGDKKKAENYRPVSLTCVVCKVLESIVRVKLMFHMESNNLFSKDQFDFRSGYSCVTQL